MKITSFWLWLLFGCLLLVPISGCTPATQEMPNPTSISATILSTEISGIESCEEVEGNCIELFFDGENCLYNGPSEFLTGPVTLIFFNESESIAAVNLVLHTGDETIQDMIDYIGEEPSSAHAPAWTRALGTWELIRSGVIYTWEGNLESGIHTMVCASPRDGIWYGGGFTVEE